MQAQNRHHVTVHCIEGAPVHQSTPPEPRNSTRAAYPTMPPHAIDWFRGRSVAVEHLKSAGGIRPAHTEMIQSRVEPCEIMHTAREFISKAETCQQSFRGAVLVQNAYGWDALAATVVRRSQTAHCSHLRSRVSVGLEAPKGNQRRQQSGEKSGADLREPCY